MKVKILLFATLKDLTGQNNLTLNLPAESGTREDVRAALVSQYPKQEAKLTAANASGKEQCASQVNKLRDG